MNKHLLLVANCFPVKGFKRSIICDVIRYRYEFIPNSMYDFLIKYNKKRWNDIIKEFNPEQQPILEDYIQFLVSKEFVFFTESPDLFPDIEVFWDSPLTITNAIIDFKKDSNHDLSKIINSLNDLRCEALEFRYFNTMDQIKILNDVGYTKNSTFRSLSLLIKYNPASDYNILLNKLGTEGRVQSISIHSCPNKDVIKQLNEIETRALVYCSSDNITDEIHCGAISKLNFSVNIHLFMESHKFNSCLNRKISVDSNGYVKNCPTMEKHYGHHNEVDFKDVLANSDFRKLWNITKDEVNVCQDCEFRYICTDCRAFLKADEIYSQPIKCKYDPYNAQWLD